MPVSVCILSLVHSPETSGILEDHGNPQSATRSSRGCAEVASWLEPMTVAAGMCYAAMKLACAL